jgi:uncharacterized protein (DUF4415 family)
MDSYGVRGSSVVRRGLSRSVRVLDEARPPVEAPKVHIGFRLAVDVVEGIRATGRGYNARVEKILREAIAKGGL